MSDELLALLRSMLQVWDAGYSVQPTSHMAVALRFLVEDETRRRLTEDTAEHTPLPQPDLGGEG